MSTEQTKTRGVRKTRSGTVVSDAMDKTVVVRVERRVPHPLYGKTIRVARKFHAHDENNKARVGDKVRIVETRPMSRTKRWRLLDIVQRGSMLEAEGTP